MLIVYIIDSIYCCICRWPLFSVENTPMRQKCTISFLLQFVSSSLLTKLCFKNFLMFHVLFSSEVQIKCWWMRVIMGTVSPLKQWVVAIICYTFTKTIKICLKLHELQNNLNSQIIHTICWLVCFVLLLQSYGPVSVISCYRQRLDLCSIWVLCVAPLNRNRSQTALRAVLGTGECTIYSLCSKMMS